MGATDSSTADSNRRQKDGSTTWPSSAKLDAAAQGAAAVRSEAEDEGPQAPKQSVRARIPREKLYTDGRDRLINGRFEPPTKRRFDNLAVLGQVGRCRARRGGGPQRSGGRGAAGPEAIRPGAHEIKGLQSGRMHSLCYRLASETGQPFLAKAQGLGYWTI